MRQGVQQKSNGGHPLRKQEAGEEGWSSASATTKEKSHFTKDREEWQTEHRNTENNDEEETQEKDTQGFVERAMWHANGSMVNLPKEQSTMIPLGRFKGSGTHGGNEVQPYRSPTSTTS